MKTNEKTAWLDAEKRLRESSHDPRPKGYITPKEYAEMMDVTEHRAQVVLKRMHDNKIVDRKFWRCGPLSCYVYKIKGDK